ncbi:MAG: hypothetical protein RIM68_15095, partial [Arenibacter sp.]
MVLVLGCSQSSKTSFGTNYLKISINEKGFIYSIKDLTKSEPRELSPSDSPSPLLTLYNSKLDTLYRPLSAEFNKSHSLIELVFPNN